MRAQYASAVSYGNSEFRQSFRQHIAHLLRLFSRFNFNHGRRLRLRALLGQDLDRLEQRPLAAANSLPSPSCAPKENDPCETRSVA